MDLAELKLSLLRTKGAVDFYEELLSSKIQDKRILDQKLLLVQGEILKLTMKNEQIIKSLENKFRQ